MKNITDNIDEWILHNIFWPYQYMIFPDADKPICKIPWNSDVIIFHLKAHFYGDDWAICVLNRIKKINPKISKSINHPVVNFIRDYLTIEKTKND